MAATPDKLQEEQEAFDAMVDDLLPEHKGEYVVFKDYKPVEFYASFAEAYEGALEQFGLNEVYLISEVSTRPRNSSSLSWDLAVL